MESSITKRAREFMESSRKKKKRDREENERVGELLESSGSKGKKKMRGCTLWWVYVCGKELLESSDGYTCVVDKMQEKKKRKETYG